MKKPKNEISLGPEIGPNERWAMRRNGDELTLGTLAPLKEGKPLRENAEIVAFKDAEYHDWQDVEVLYKNMSGGPAQVATPAYRENYDRIFGKKPTVGVA